MLNIVTFMGGLGNQMFAYAFYYALKKEKKFTIIITNTFSSETQHYGYELDSIFTGVDKKKYRFINEWSFKFIQKKICRIIEQPKVGYFNSFIQNNYPFLVYKGFWQSEFYFKTYEAEIKKAFTFDHSLFQNSTKTALINIKNSNSVSIHIRRGDYKNNTELGNICTIDYYKEAIKYVSFREKNLTFYIFSDEPEWVKNIFEDLSYTLVDWNRGKDSWQDMLLMSNCKHNIIANSSFSWWGAWLNNNSEKLVIAPIKWFNTLPDNDIVPSSWIRL